MTTGPQPAAAPAAAGELYPPPAADLLELFAKCGSDSAEERLEAATLMGRLGAADTRSAQLAQSRLTQLLLDRSPAVVEAAWNSLGVLAEQDDELAATLRVLTRICAGRGETEPPAAKGPSPTPSDGEEASRERPSADSLLQELEGMRRSLADATGPRREQFKGLLDRMAGVSFGAANKQAVSLVNSIAELVGVEFVAPADHTAKAILVFVPSGSGSGNIVLRKKTTEGKQDNLSNRTRFPDQLTFRERAFSQTGLARKDSHGTEDEPLEGTGTSSPDKSTQAVLPAAGGTGYDVRRLTVDQAAERLGLGRTMVQRYAQEKRIGELIGRQYLFSEAELDEFAKKPRPIGRPRQQEVEEQTHLPLTANAGTHMPPTGVTEKWFNELFQRTTYTRDDLQGELDKLSGQKLPTYADNLAVLTRLKAATAGSRLKLYFGGQPVVLELRVSPHSDVSTGGTAGSIFLRRAGRQDRSTIWSGTTWPALETRAK